VNIVNEPPGSMKCWHDGLAASQEGLSSKELVVNKMFKGQCWESGLRALQLSLTSLLRLLNKTGR
jgi:hypothetical protein